jgi:hypothetical protein
MEYITIPINGARRNPDKNPRISIVDQLKPYYEKEKRSGLSKYYFTFTTINKVGIKPKSAFDTPLGVYAYPMIQMYSFLEANEIPFAGDREFINLLELNVPDNKVLSQSTTESQADLALKKLEELFKSEANKEGSFLRKNNKYVRASDFNKYVGLAKESYPRSFNTPYGKVWNVSHYLAEEMFPQNFDSKTLLYWNILLRKIGFEAAVDYEGTGFIHPNERFQAVFFTKKAIKHVATFDNKRYEEYSRNISGLYSSDTSKEILDFFKKEGNITVEKLRGSNIILSKGELKGKTVPLFVSGTILSNIYNSIIGEKKEKDKINSYKDYMTKLENNRSSEYSLFINPSNSHISNVVKNCLIQDGNFGSTCKISNCIIEGGFITGEFKNCKITNCSLYYNELAFINVSGVTDSYWFIDNLNYYRRKAYNKAERELPFNKMVKKLGGTEYEKQRANIIYNIILEEMRKYFSIESIIYTTGRAIFK